MAASGSQGAVYALTNNPVANAVAAFDRAADGTLTFAGTVPIGGRGTSMFGTGNQSGLLLSKNHRCLYAVNVGSHEIAWSLPWRTMA
jgi:6-phosphogluconolactonase